MDYEEFKLHLIEALRKSLPQELKHGEVMIQHFTYEGMSEEYLYLETANTSEERPLYRIKSLYDAFKSQGIEVLADFIDSFIELNLDFGVTSNISQYFQTLDKSTILNTVIPRIGGLRAISANPALSEIVFNYTDLFEVTYRIPLPTKRMGDFIILSKRMIESSNLTLETIQENALNNFIREYPLEISSLKSVGTNHLILCTSSDHIFGASYLLAPDILEKISKKVGGSYHILLTHCDNFLVVTGSQNLSQLKDIYKTYQNLLRNSHYNMDKDSILGGILYYDAHNKTLSMLGRGGS